MNKLKLVAILMIIITHTLFIPHDVIAKSSMRVSPVRVRTTSPLSSGSTGVKVSKTISPNTSSSVKPSSSSVKQSSSFIKSSFSNNMNGNSSYNGGIPNWLMWSHLFNNNNNSNGNNDDVDKPVTVEEIQNTKNTDNDDSTDKWIQIVVGGFLFIGVVSFIGYIWLKKI